MQVEKIIGLCREKLSAVRHRPSQKDDASRRAGSGILRRWTHAREKSGPSRFGHLEGPIADAPTVLAW